MKLTSAREMGNYCLPQGNTAVITWHQAMGEHVKTFLLKAFGGELQEQPILEDAAA